MVKIKKLFHFLPRRYRCYPFILCFICLLVFLIYYQHQHSEELHEEIITEINTDDDFDLFDDDDMRLSCPQEIQFNISNRRHLAIIVAPELLPFVWKNFHALLCTGIDVYIMFDEPFNIKSSSRVDNYPAHTKRSIRSYTYRFLYISNNKLEKYGVRYMTKFPSIEYSAWDRTVVWLYHRNYLTTAWVINFSVQWFHVHNMTYLFDIYASDTSDIVCEDIVGTDSAQWKQWPKIETDIFPKSSWIGTYSPLVRWSRRLLFHHYQYMQLIHKNRLKYEIDNNYRFKEFLMGTIANIERLSIALFYEKTNFLHISLGDYNQTYILNLLRQGKHIIHPIIYDSVLTKYRIDDIAKLMTNNLM